MPELTRTQLPVNAQALPAKHKRNGATLMEYLMMASLVITVCLIAIGYLGTSNNANMSSSSNQINNSLNKSGSNSNTNGSSSDSKGNSKGKGYSHGNNGNNGDNGN